MSERSGWRSIHFARTARAQPLTENVARMLRLASQNGNALVLREPIVPHPIYEISIRASKNAAKPDSSADSA